MSVGFIPAPGQPLGPCNHECDHKDCNELRSTAESICPLCWMPISYNVEYITLDGVIYHAACLETDIEQRR